jgi:hypothetical protein
VNAHAERNGHPPTLTSALIARFCNGLLHKLKGELAALAARPPTRTRQADEQALRQEIAAVEELLNLLREDF